MVSCQQQKEEEEAAKPGEREVNKQFKYINFPQVDNEIMNNDVGGVLQNEPNILYYIFIAYFMHMNY